MLMCVLSHSRFIKNPPIESWEINSCLSRGVLSHLHEKRKAKAVEAIPLGRLAMWLG
jgi:hypothetical protein